MSRFYLPIGFLHGPMLISLLLRTHLFTYRVLTAQMLARSGLSDIYVVTRPLEDGGAVPRKKEPANHYKPL